MTHLMRLREICHEIGRNTGFAIMTAPNKREWWHFTFLISLKLYVVDTFHKLPAVSVFTNHILHTNILVY